MCETERASVYVYNLGWQRGRERDNLRQTLHLAQSPTRGLIPGPWDRDLSHNQETDAQLTELLRHAPLYRAHFKEIEGV